jgi:hypothetical protein
MHVANRSDILCSHASTQLNTHYSRLAGTTAAQPFPTPWLLACLRRRARRSGQVTSDSGHALWGPSDPDLSRGNGDYTPRDKTICAMNPKRCALGCVCSVVSTDNKDSFQSHRNGRLPNLISFRLFFCFCSSDPCLHGSCSWQPRPDPVTF